jgi:RiboL-PSP-HEPN
MPEPAVQREEITIRTISRAQETLLSNSADISRVFEIHKLLGGSNPGRRRRLEVVNKAAVVLITAIWEAFCEDLAAEALTHLVEHSKSPLSLPMDLRRRIARELAKDRHELAVWQLADDGWRNLLRKRQNELQEERNRRLNTPKTVQIDEFFQSSLGIGPISEAWTWSGMSAEQARKKLDGYVALRGEIAHRGAAAKPVSKTTVKNYYNHARRLAVCTARSVNFAMMDATGARLYVVEVPYTNV